MSDKGNFTTRINKDKRRGDSKPVYEGRLTVPGTGDEYGFALYLGEDKTDRKYFSGSITRQPVNGKVDDQLSALLAAETAKAPEGGEDQDRPYRLFLLPSQPSKKSEGKGEPPNFWGRAMLAAASSPIQILVWEQDSRYQINPHITKYLRGNTQCPLDKGTVAEPGVEERDGR